LVLPSLAATYDRAALIAKFDTMDQALKKGEGYSSYTNEYGELAWGESYLLEAYLDMFEGTRDTKYLAKFVRQADRVIGNMDQKQGKRDYKGRSAIGWGTARYSKRGEQVVWLVHSGMITYPMARFAWLVKKDKLIGFQKDADRYAEVAKSAMSLFDRNWIYGKASGTGYYQFDPDEPINANEPHPPMPLPFNMQLAAGRTFLMLYQLTGDQADLQKAAGLALHFKNNVQKVTEGSFSWNYWYGKGLEKYKGVEDISHGAIDVDFAILAYRAGVVFNKEDMISFLRTFTKKISKNGKFAEKVDGTGAADTYKNQAGLWLELSEFNCKPWDDFSFLLKDGKLPGEPEVLLGVAKLVKFYGKCGKQ
jgi:hypothetical protein